MTRNIDRDAPARDWRDEYYRIARELAGDDYEQIARRAVALYVRRGLCDTVAECVGLAMEEGANA